MTSSSRSTELLKFGSKAPLKKLRNLSHEPKERTTTVWKLAEWLGVTAAGIGVSEDNDLKEQRAASNGQGIVRITAGCEDTLKVRRLVSRHS
jgi:hypothetical protein